MSRKVATNADKAYIPALDGLRAFAVAAVLVFHGGFAWAGGGFLGVDVFFVLSGYLITGLLVEEFRRSGTIAFGRFWMRRARRLLPALLVMLAGVAVYAAVLAPPDTLADLRRQGLATLLYVANWNQVSSQQTYFSALTTPSPLLHTWSLAIEEQFYLLWPLVVYAILRVARSRAVLATVCVAGAIASAVAMAVLYHHGLGVNRVYYGTDTRAQDLLVGAVLAIWVPASAVRAGTSTQKVERGRPDTRAVLVDLTGLAALAGIVVAIARLGAGSTDLYFGGFLVVSGATAVVIAAVVIAPRGVLGRSLSLRPVRYIGRISYGLYLWHWPIFLVLDNARTGMLGWPLFALRVGATIGFAAASARWVETPVRRGTFTGRSWRLGMPAAYAAVAVSIVAATAGAVPAVASPFPGPVPNTVGGVEAARDATGTGSPADPLSALPSYSVLAGGPIRFLLVGDSEAAFLAFGLAPDAQRYGVEYQGDAVLGCGLVQGGPTRIRGVLASSTVGSVGPKLLPVPCSAQWRRWHNDLVTYRPDVVALEEGALEVRDHFVDGTWVHLGQPVLDRLELAAITRAVSVLSSTGAKVILLTAPFYRQPEQMNGSPWPEDDPARVDAYNRLLREVAARFPTSVVVVDLNRRLDPSGTFAATIGGQAMRLSDGIHPSAAAGRYVQSWLLPIVAALGRENRRAHASARRRSG